MSDTTKESEKKSKTQKNSHSKTTKESRRYEDLLNPNFSDFEKSVPRTLKILSSLKTHNQSEKVLTSFQFIDQNFQHILKNLPHVKKNKIFKTVINSLKSLNQIFKNFNLKNFRLCTFEMTFVYLTSICTISGHGLYFTLKILITCLEKNWKLDWIIKDDLLLRLNAGIKNMKFSKKRGYKNVILKLKKLLKLMRKENKEKILKGVVNFCEDLNPKIQLNEVFKSIVLENCFAFKSEFLTVLNILEPEQLDLVYSGDEILGEIIPKEEAEREEFYYKDNLENFFLKLLSGGNLDTIKLNYLMLFINNFEVIWSRMKFHKNLIVDLCDVFYSNIERFYHDEKNFVNFENFLVKNQLTSDPHFYNNITVLKDTAYFIKIMIYNSILENKGIYNFKKKKGKLEEDFERFLKEGQNIDKKASIRSNIFSTEKGKYRGISFYNNEKMENKEFTFKPSTRKILKKSHTKVISNLSPTPFYKKLRVRVMNILGRELLVSLKTGEEEEINVLNIKDMKSGKIIFNKSFPKFEKFSIMKNKIFYWGKFSVSIIEIFATKDNDLIPKIVFFKNFTSFYITKILPFDDNLIAIFSGMKPFIYFYDFTKNVFLINKLSCEQRDLLESKLKELEESE